MCGIGKVYQLMDHLLERAELESEPMPAQPVIEIAGDTRVLIENHKGVKAYSSVQILVNVTYGSVCVSGCGLQLVRMTREQLVIRGRIDSVSLQRRNS